jgi:hypothetical protein
MGVKQYKKPIGACGLCGEPVFKSLGVVSGASGEPLFEFCTSECYSSFNIALRDEWESDERARQEKVNALPF